MDWIKRIAICCCVPASVLLAWYLLYLYQGDSLRYAVNPFDVFYYISENVDQLLNNLWLSVIRIFWGVILGTTLGIFCGVLVARRNVLTALFSPTLNVLAAVPIIVLIPFFLMIFGANQSFRIAVVTAVVFFIVYQTMFAVVKNFPKEYLDYAAHRKKSFKSIFYSLYLKSSIPELIKAIRLSLLFAWLAIVLAEKSVAQWPKGGLGYQIIRAKELGHNVEMFSAVVVLAISALLLDYFLKNLQIYASRWMDVREFD